jgi:hypothetical protein
MLTDPAPATETAPLMLTDPAPLMLTDPAPLPLLAPVARLMDTSALTSAPAGAAPVNTFGMPLLHSTQPLGPSLLQPVQVRSTHPVHGHGHGGLFERRRDISSHA